MTSINTVNNEFRSGFVAFIGRPNVGKSTLLNKIVGQKVAIMSDKPQTTRNKIQGVYTDDRMQAIFLDTPGIHKPHHQLGQYMNKAASSAIGDVDLIFFLVDATEPLGGGDRFIAERLAKEKKPVFLIINKIDILTPDEILVAIDSYKGLLDCAEVVPVSALTGNNIAHLLNVLYGYLLPGPCYYEPGTTHDQPESRIMAEIIREKILQLTQEEIPHSVAVEVTELCPRPDETLYLRAHIYVERESQKGIIIGKRGAMLKEIGSRSRRELEAVFGNKIYLDLYVKARKDWRNNPSQLQKLGYLDQDL